MKLLKDNKALHADEFSNASPYVIMFGPDKCGATNKVCRVHGGISLLMLIAVRFTSSSNTKTQRRESMRKSI